MGLPIAFAGDELEIAFVSELFNFLRVGQAARQNVTLLHRSLFVSY